MNLLEAALMERPSILADSCCVCGGHGWLERHHVVFRSQGGAKGPRLTLCRDCHGKAHERRLHFRWADGWEALTTPTATKCDTALGMEGWRRL